MTNIVAEYLESFRSLLFPNLCYSCSGVLSKNESVICLICENSLPKTNFHEVSENPIFNRLYGRIQIENATALFYFDKGNKVQHLMHLLKYSGKKEVGTHLGKMLGKDLATSAGFKNISAVIPVPLHEKKLRKRGYNQAEYFARGIAEAIKTSMVTNVLKRVENTETQTGKNRFERWDNVKEAFVLNNKNSLMNQHVLLVDDVVTTGATLEACAQHLMEIEGLKISIATIAFAH